MTHTQIISQITRDSAKRFLSTKYLTRKYGTFAIDAMAVVKAENPDRLRIYGREAGGIGPAK